MIHVEGNAERSHYTLLHVILWESSHATTALGRKRFVTFRNHN